MVDYKNVYREQKYLKQKVPYKTYWLLKLVLPYTLVKLDQCLLSQNVYSLGLTFCYYHSSSIFHYYFLISCIS